MVIQGNEENVTVTDDPEHIRDWIEEHKGRPAIASETDTDDVILDIEFEDEDSDRKLETIPWEEFFKILNDKDLSFAYAQSDEVTLSRQKFDFKDRDEANTEMEEPEVYGNTLETADDAESR